MKKQERPVTKKMGRPKSEPTSVVRLPHATVEAANKWALKQEDRPKSPEAIRRLVELAIRREK